jgi:predicted dehydrogenase
MKMERSKKPITRRKFIDTSVKATLLSSFVSGGFPTIVPSGIFGKNAPSNKINIGQIGFGRIAMTHDLTETLKYDVARVVAVADLDYNRASTGKQFIENFYSRKTGKTGYVDVKVYEDYRLLLQNPKIDAVIISTPDHWHAQPAIDAALAGKDIYLQKPTSLTIKEGRLLSDVVRRQKVILQVGTCKKWKDRKT